MRPCPFGRAIALIVAFGASAVGQRAPRVEVAEEPSCPRCVIEVARIATLGQPVTDAVIDGVTRSLVALPHGGFLLLTYGSGKLPLRFSEDGKYLGPLGRKGEGPGEFGNPIHLRVTGDTLRVIDAAPSRASVFTADLRFVRSEPLDPVAPPVADVLYLRDGGVVLSAPGTGPDGLPRLLHYRNPQKGRSADFDYPAVFMSSQPNLQRRQLAAGSGNTLWSLHGLEYVLDHWTPEGKLIEQVTRQVPWFPAAPAGMTAPSPTTPPQPLGLRIHADDSGLLWVFILVADKNWASGLIESGRGQFRIDNRGKYYDTIIEVIDVVERKVVARKRVDEAIALATSARVTAGDREVDGLYPVVDVWRLKLIKP
jgi:hypothetical protein